MKTESRTFRSRVMLGLPIFVVLIFVTLTASAQINFEPAPENFKVSDQTDSPGRITINRVSISPSKSRLLDYSVKNVGTKEIQSIILLDSNGNKSTPFIIGLPAGEQLSYGQGLPSGADKRLLYGYAAEDGKPDEKAFKTDFVLFRDGTTWGPDTAGEAERLLGIFDGQKRFISDVKKLVGNKDDEGLKALIMRDGLPPEQVGIENRTKRLMGGGSGYNVARLSFRSDLLGRGDLTGVPARIRDIELELGLAPLPDDRRKQITVQYGFNAPLKFTGISLDGRNLSLDERFSVEGDWLTGIRVKVRNDSGKAIKSVSLGIRFPETSRTGQVMSSSLRYGPHPLTHEENEKQLRVVPGQSFEILVDDTGQGGLRKSLERRQSFDTISRAVIDISYIEFDDGTRWSGGQYMKPDPENPKRWVPIKSDGH